MQDWSTTMPLEHYLGRGLTKTDLSRPFGSASGQSTTGSSRGRWSATWPLARLGTGHDRRWRPTCTPARESSNRGGRSACSLFTRRSTLTIICITILVYIANHLTGQELAPSIRIEAASPSFLMRFEPIFSTDGDYLLIRTFPDKVRRYDLVQRRFDLQLALPSPGLSAISSDGNLLLRIDHAASEIHVIDFESGDAFRTVPIPAAYDPSGNDSPDELTFKRDDDGLIVWRTNNQIFVAEISSGTWTTLASAQFFGVSDSSCLTVVGSSDSVVASQCESGPVHRKFHHVRDLSLSRDGSKLLVIEVTSDGVDVLHVLDSRMLTALHEPFVMHHHDDGYAYLGNAWRDDRPIVLYNVGEIDGTLTVLDIVGRTVMLSLPSRGIEYAVISPDGRWLARERDQVVEVYSLGAARSAPERLPRLVPQVWHSGPVYALSLSQDGRIVAVSGSDGWVSLWDRRSGKSFRRQLRESPAVSLSQDGKRMMTTELNGGAATWDVASGEVVRGLPGDLFGTGNVFATFLADDARALLCNFRNLCTLRDLEVDWVHKDGVSRIDSGLSRGLLRDRSPEFGDYFYHAVSLAPDEKSVSLALGDKGVGWMELTSDGRQRIIQVPGDVQVTAVAALNGDRVVAGLSNGDIRLIDVRRGETMHVLHARETKISAIVRVDDLRIAVASDGHLPALMSGQFDSSNMAEILLVSQRDFSVLERIVVNRTTVGQLAASRDGRWLVSVSQPWWAVRYDVADLVVWNADSLEISEDPWWSSQEEALVQIWDMETLQEYAELGSRVLQPLRVEFGTTSHRLLVDGRTVASLWNLEQGNITQQFYHRESLTPNQTYAALVDDTVIYRPDGLAEERAGLKSWSPRSGLRDVVVPDAVIECVDWFGTLVVDGSRIGVAASWKKVILLSLGDAGQPAFCIDREDPVHVSIQLGDGPAIHLAGGLLLLSWGRDGIEAVDASTGALIWRRDDIVDPSRSDTHVARLMLTADHSGVIAITRDGRLLLLEVVDGKRRLMLKNEDSGILVPVSQQDVARDVLRMTDDYRIERLSMQDGSVIDAANLGISSLEFAVSNHNGDMYLVADGMGQAVLWDTKSGIRTVLESEAVGPESVSFSPDGRVMAVVETDGTVGLWDVSRGPAGLQRLARLITFADGDWAVVGEDGRYDASDPADLDGLNWVMPNAPTEPVPLAVYYRDYYEPGLLPRLLAGEEFRPIRSITDRDRTQPHVQVTGVEHAGDGHVNVTVEVKRSGANGVGDLKLFRDGRLVELKENLGQSAPSSADTWRVTFGDIALPTSDVEAVEFSAYAFNADGIKSDTHRFRFEDLPEAEARPRRAFVIVVGVSAYQNESWDLHYAAEDARAAGDIVTEHLKASGTFDEVHTVSLIAERDDESGEVTGTATRADVLAVLDVLAGEPGDPERLQAIEGAAALTMATPDDLVYFSFSGHGLSGEDGIFHLFLTDIGAGVERQVDKSLLRRTLDSDMLAQSLRRVDAGDFAMVIDACNAAASVQGGGFKPGPMGSRGLGQLAYDKAMRVLAASQAEEVALESDQLRHGLLTYAMLREGLVGGAADRAPQDGSIDFTEMLNYGVHRVPLLYEDIRDGSFSALGRGLTAYEPSCGSEQAHEGASGCREQSVTSVQRPTLFDFSRTEQDVRMPVLHATP